jgi:hypothetical protein
MPDSNPRTRRRNAELAAEVKRLRAALAFYADEKTWTEIKVANGALGEFTTSLILEDAGCIAQAALSSG